VTDGMRPYPEYKDSGLPWLGKVPAHWDVLRAKSLFRLSIERSAAQHGMELLSIYTHIGVKPRKDLEQRGNKATTTDGYWIVRKGDLIVNKLLAWMGAVGVSHYDGVTSPAYDILRPRRLLSSDFYHYLFRIGDYLQQFKCRSRGIMDMRLRLYFDQLGQIPVVVPPPNEQDAIVAFLDDIFRRTNKFIRNRRRLIEVLTEQKQAIINRAVTRGLNPNASLKPSGIDWLGEIPEHWGTAALRLRYDQCLGKMVDAKRFTGMNAIPYLRNTDVQWDRINVDDLPLIDITQDELERFSVKSGDLLVCEGGDVGRCAFWDARIPVCGFQKALHRLRPLDPNRDYPRFMYYCMYSASKLGVFVAGGSENTIAHLTGVKLRAHRFAFPPYDEQREIGAHLDGVLNQNEHAITVAQREIDLIREYRTRLIADVVTGKLDVRHLAPADDLPTGETDDDTELADDIDGEEAMNDEPELIEEADV